MPQIPEQAPPGVYMDPDSIIERQLRLDAKYELFLTRHQELTASTTYHPYQLDTLDSLKACLGVRTQQGASGAHVANISATGTGKSVTALSALWMLGTGSEIHGERSQALWIAPENHLFDNVRRARDFLGVDLSISNWSAREHDASGDIITINTLTFSKEWLRFLRGDEQGVPFVQIDEAIFDEAHLAMGELTERQVQAFQKGRFSLANTATPWLKHGKNILEMWPDLIAYLDLRQAVEVYGITKFDRPLDFYTLSPKEGFTIDNLTRSGDLTEADLERIFDSESLKDFTARLAVLLSKHNCKTIFFTPRGASSQFARDMEERLNNKVIFKEHDEHSLTARAIGGFDASGSALVLKDFDAGEVDVVFSSKMAEVGYDGRSTSAVVLLTQINSGSTVVQRIGRLLHNDDPNSSLIVIFVNYKIFNRANQSLVSQLTPAELFDLPLEGVTSLQPNNNDHSEPYLTLLKDILNHVPDDHKTGITDFRHPYPRPVRRSKKQTGQHKTPIVSPMLRQEIENLVAANPLVVTNKSSVTVHNRQTPADNEHSIEEICEVADMDPVHLVQILRQEKQRITSRQINQQRVEFCEEKSADILDEVVATERHYSPHRMARILGIPVAAVRRSISALSKTTIDLSFEERYDRQYTFNSRGIAIKDRQYAQAVLHAVGKHRASLSTEKFANERSLPEFVNASGRDAKHVYEYLAKQGYQAVQRAVAGVSFAVNCYRIPDAEFNQLVDELKLPPELPNSTDYINTSQIASRYVRHLGFTRHDLEALIEDTNFPSYEFSIAGGRYATFVETAHVMRFVTYVKKAFAAGEIKGSKPPRNAAMSPAADQARQQQEQGLGDSKPTVRPDYPLNMHTHDTISRFGDLPQLPRVLPYRVVSLINLSRTRRYPIDALVAIAKSHTAIDNPCIALNDDGEITIDIRVRAKLDIFLQNCQPHVVIPSQWRWVDDVARCYNLNASELTRLLTSGRFGTNHVRAIKHSQLTKMLVFCSPSIIASVLNAQKKT